MLSPSHDFSSKASVDVPVLPKSVAKLDVTDGDSNLEGVEDLISSSRKSTERASAYLYYPTS